MDRAQLADFLVHRRAAISPEDVGFPRGARRRTSGLRREEVALLCDISVDYYSRLEQGRSAQPSEQILAALARGLRLSLDERDHLYRLGGLRPPARQAGDTHVSRGLMRVLDSLDGVPAVVMSAFGDVLVQTPVARAIFGDERTQTGNQRNAAYRWFTEPGARDAYPVDARAQQSELLTADLRASFSAHGGSSRVAAVVTELLERSPEFAELWARHEVAKIPTHAKRLQNAEVGELLLDCQMLHDHEQGQVLLVFTATPGSETVDKLRLLAVIGSQRLSDADRMGFRTGDAR